MWKEVLQNVLQAVVDEDVLLLVLHHMASLQSHLMHSAEYVQIPSVFDVLHQPVQSDKRSTSANAGTAMNDCWLIVGRGR